MNISKRSIKAVLNSLDTTKNTLNIMLTLEQKKEAKEDIKEQLKDVEEAIEEIKEIDKMNKVIKNAYEIMELQEKRFHDCLPEVEIGEQCELGKIWDGEGEVSEDSYSYLISNNGEDGNSNYNVWIDYRFKIIKEEEDLLDTIIEITDICLL